MVLDVFHDDPFAANIESFDVLRSENGDFLFSSPSNHAYATEYQEELFAKRKSLEMARSTIEFRTNTPT
jgi:hypothetical protein